VADLLLYLLRNSSRVPEEQIDTASLLAGATFTNVNGFWFNGVVSESTNVRDWIDSTLQYFLLRQARVAGKEAVSPLLPVNNDSTIKTTAVSWEFTFTEEHIIPDSFEITYTALADRKPFCAMVLWRQQDDNGIGIIRTAEVRYAGTAVDGPYEQHDLSEFCASENHAVKVGAYIISKRRHVTHRLQIGVKPDAFNPTLAPGDLVRVRLDRIASTGASSTHDFLYELDRIGKSVSGDVRLELTHFPVDATNASIVAQEVNAAVGGGVLLPTGLTGITCDINSSTDTSVPADTSLDPSAWNLPGFNTFDFGISNFGNDAFDGGEVSNPRDTLNGQTSEGPSISPANEDGNYIGQTWTLEDCPSGCSIQWLRNGQPISGATNASYTTTIEDAGSDVAVQCCDQEIEGFEAGTDPLPPPPAGTDPSVRVYWILGNIFCLGGACAQGKTIEGFITVNYSYFAGGNMRFESVSSSFPQIQCKCVGNEPSFDGCKKSVSNPQGCDDLGCCTTMVYFEDLQLLNSSGTWVTNRTVTSNGLKPEFVAVYAST
jgi:hypothetical protein